MSLTNICTFSNRVAFVTGAAGNIGLALCRRLAAHGVGIAAADLSKDVLNERLAEINNLRAYQIDVRDPQSV